MPKTGNTEGIEMLDKNKGNRDGRNFGVYNSKHPTCKENLSYYFSQYCGATSIHGVQYVGERGRLLIEKLVWIVIITIVAGTCIFLITKTYNKWVTTPTIVTFAITETPISEIPFPAVSVLPEVNADPEKFNFTAVLMKKLNENEKLSYLENWYFESFSLICESMADLSIYGKDDKGNATTDDSFLPFLLNANPFLSENGMIFYGWPGEGEGVRYMYNSSKLIQLTPTEDGFAFSFNRLDDEDIYTKTSYNETSIYNKAAGTKIKSWNLDEGYPKGQSRDTYPKRSFVPGIKRGFSMVTFTNRSHVKDSCNKVFSGYRVTLHHPCELPNLDNHFRLPLGQAVFVAIKPKMITISEKLKSYKPEDRKCYLSEERKLKYFAYYTQENCMRECLLNVTWDICHCIPHYMFPYDDNAVYCGRGSLPCLTEIKDNFGANIHDEKCNCLPSCTSLEYDVEISQTDWNFWDYLSPLLLEHKDFDFSINFSVVEPSALFVYYKEMQFLASERNELFGIVDFFSNIGGLLGLFIGISVTSGIEILYFLTLRLICNIRKFGKEFWSGAPELIDAANTEE